MWQWDKYIRLWAKGTGILFLWPCDLNHCGVLWLQGQNRLASGRTVRTVMTRHSGWTTRSTAPFLESWWVLLVTHCWKFTWFLPSLSFSDNLSSLLPSLPSFKPGYLFLLLTVSLYSTHGYTFYSTTKSVCWSFQLWKKTGDSDVPCKRVSNVYAWRIEDTAFFMQYPTSLLLSNVSVSSNSWFQVQRAVY